MVPSLSGADIVVIDVGGAPAPTRLLTYLDGVTFSDCAPLPFDALAAVGAAQGELACALGGFEHSAATNFMAWSLDSGMIHHPQLWDGTQR